MTTALTTTTPRNTKRHTLRKWVQRIALFCIALGPLALLIAALGYRLGILDLGFAFGVLNTKVGLFSLAGALLTGVIGLLMGFFIAPKRRLLTMGVIVLVALFGLNRMMSVGKTVEKLPFIHDVTTDTQDPPVFTQAILSERAKTEGVNTVDYVGKVDKREKELVSVLQVRDYPDIRTLVLSDTPEVVFGRAKAAAKNQGWKIVSEDVDAGIIEATETTFWYGFKDDVVIRIRGVESGGSVLDIRSISRVGASDLGVNAERVRAFIKDVQE